MKQFIKIALSAATIFCMVMLTSCDKQPNNNNNGELENGDNEFFDGKTIRGEIVNGDYYDDVYGLSVVKFALHSEGSCWESLNIGSGEYVNGGFTLTLPESIASSDLEYMWDPFDREYFVFSDTNVRTLNNSYNGASGSVVIYNSAGVCKEGFNYETGYVECSGKQVNNVYPPFVSFLYVDRDVTIKSLPKGEEEEELRVDLSLKKGWNCVYHYYDIGTHLPDEDDFRMNYTTTPPEGSAGTYKWYFNYEDYFSEWGLDYDYFLAM